MKMRSGERSWAEIRMWRWWKRYSDVKMQDGAPAYC